MLLGHHMYDKPLPTTSPVSSELVHLAAWLDLIPTPGLTASSLTTVKLEQYVETWLDKVNLGSIKYILRIVR